MRWPRQLSTRSRPRSIRNALRLGRRRDERDADPLGLHLDHLRAQGLLGRAAGRDHRCSGSRPGLPIFLGNLEVCTRVTEEMYGREAWQPGDVWIMNDSYPGGHAPERHDGVRADLPSRRAGRLRRLARALARRGRQGRGRPDGLDRDLPGGHPPRRRPRWSRAAATGDDMVDLLARNSRFSYPAVGDLNAQIACARTGERRLAAIIERFGTETVAAARDEIFAQTERLDANRDRRDPGRCVRGRGRARQRRPLATTP